MLQMLHLRLRRSGPGYLRELGHLQQSMDGAGLTFSQKGNRCRMVHS